MMKNLIPQMPSLRRAALLLLPALLLALPTSCIKEEMATDKATVTMTFTTRGITATSLDGTLDDNEQMRTLRVIVARNSNNEIVYNEIYDIAPEETKKVITFSELTVSETGEDFDFYAIANESSFLGTGESLAGKNIDLAQLEERIITTSFTTETSIPQAQKGNYHVEAKEGVQTYSMKLEFPVAKVCLTFSNETGVTQYFGNITMPQADPGKGYLFPHDALPGELNNPYTDISLHTYNSNNSTTSFAVPAGTEDAPAASETLVCYLYPGDKGTASYSLTAEWLDEVNPRTLEFELNGGKVTAMERGKQLNVTITLKPGEPIESTLEYELANWTNVSIDVPFN